jgi:hypothetical protein
MTPATTFLRACGHYEDMGAIPADRNGTRPTTAERAAAARSVACLTCWQAARAGLALDVAALDACHAAYAPIPAAEDAVRRLADGPAGDAHGRL